MRLPAVEAAWDKGSRLPPCRVGAGWHVALGVWMWAGSGGMNGLAQRNQPVGWVISGVHADPTPALGAPEAEFVCLRALGPVGIEVPSLSGWTLGWNGHERSLEDVPSVLVGSTVIIHRASDSAAFAGWPGLRVPLSSWPALVNGGAVVELKDSLGTVQDALHYSEDDLAGGGRLTLRRNLRGCGASPNLVVWSTGMSPFSLVEPSGSGQGAYGNLDSSAADRVVPRKLGHIQWRLRQQTPFLALACAQPWVARAEVSWASDSVVDIRWTERLMPVVGFPVIRLGPVRGCAPRRRGASCRTCAKPCCGDIAPTRVLAPCPMTPVFQRSSSPDQLVDHAVDPSTWDWSGGHVLRRTQWPSGTRQFGPPGFNRGLDCGTDRASWGRLPSGSPLYAWTPCEHSRSAFGAGVPLARSAHPDVVAHRSAAGGSTPRRWWVTVASEIGWSMDRGAAAFRPTCGHHGPTARLMGEPCRTHMVPAGQGGHPKHGDALPEGGWNDRA